VFYALLNIPQSPEHFNELRQFLHLMLRLETNQELPL
jgi:hypothetical protein